MKDEYLLMQLTSVFCFISMIAFFVLFIVGADYFLNFPSNRIDLHSHKISQYC